MGVLDVNKRAVLLLAYHGSMTHDEVAEILRIPLGTMKISLARGVIRAARSTGNGGPAMNESPTPNLENDLRALTTWEGASPELWRKALDRTEQEKETGRPRKAMTLTVRRVLTIGLPAAAVLLIAVMLNVGPWGDSPIGPVQAVLEKAAQSGEGLPDYPAANAPSARGLAQSDIEALQSVGYISGEDAERLGSPGYPGGQDNRYWYAAVADDYGAYQGGGRSSGRMAPSGSDATIGPTVQTPPPPDAVRHVIRKATIELAAKDVRAAFLKAQQID